MPGNLRVTWSDLHPAVQGAIIEHRKTATPPSGPYCYAIGADGDGEPFKVGWTSGDPAKRLSAIQVGNPKRLAVRWKCLGGVEVEELIHDALSGHEIGGEWFRAEAWPVLMMWGEQNT